MFIENLLNELIGIYGITMMIAIVDLLPLAKAD
jgi:hypothetical protein